jgi:hypothetical protein
MVLISGTTISAYTLVLAAVLLSAGAVGDQAGRKRVLLAGADRLLSWPCITGNLSRCATPCISRRSASSRHAGIGSRPVIHLVMPRAAGDREESGADGGVVSGREPGHHAQLPSARPPKDNHAVPARLNTALGDPVAPAREKPRLIAALAGGHDGGGGTAPICRSRPSVCQWTHSSTNLPPTIRLSNCPST